MIHEDITLGPVRLIRGDCLQIAPTLEGVEEDDFARDPMTPRPAYVWATVAWRIVNIGVDDVLGLITDDRPENFETSDCNGLDELKAALEAFNSANQDFMYEPDRTTIVPIRWKEAK